MTFPEDPRTTTRPLVTVEELDQRLQDWESGRLDAMGMRAYLDTVLAPAPGRGKGPWRGGNQAIEAVQTVLAELDLLEVYLLTPADVPALRALLRSPDEQGQATWARYREAIDLDARSRQLRPNRFYRPFCR